jgi:hypothetical protein
MFRYGNTIQVYSTIGYTTKCWEAEKMNKRSVSVILTVFMLAILFTGCGGLQRHDSIYTYGLVSGKDFKLKFSNRQYMQGKVAGHSFIPIDKFPYTTASDITENVSMTNYYGSYWLIERDNLDSTFDYFYIAYSTGDFHIITNMGGGIDNQDGENLLLLPFHIIRDRRINAYINPRILSEVAYEIQDHTGIDDFYAFYEKSGWYSVEKSDDLLTINGYINEPADTRRLLLDFPVYIQFSRRLGQEFFTISFWHEDRAS